MHNMVHIDGIDFILKKFLESSPIPNQDKEETLSKVYISLQMAFFFVHLPGHRMTTMANVSLIVE